MDRHFLFGYQARPNAKQNKSTSSGQEGAARQQSRFSLPTLPTVQAWTDRQLATDLYHGASNQGITTPDNQKSWVKQTVGFAHQLAGRMTKSFQRLNPAVRRSELFDVQTVLISGQEALDAIPEGFPQKKLTPQLRRLADQTQVLVLDANLDQKTQDAEVQQALAALRDFHPNGQNHRVMVIQLDGKNPLTVSPQVSFWGGQGRLIGSGETEAARLLQEVVVPKMLTTGQLDFDSPEALGQKVSQSPSVAGGVKFGIIDPFTIAGAVALGVGATSGAVYKWRSGKAKQKWLKEQVDGVNQYLAQIGCIDKVNDKNIFSLQTVELILSQGNQIQDCQKMDQWIGLICDNLPKETKNKPETYYSLLQIYLKKGLPHTSPKVREYFVNYLQQSNNIKREFYNAFYEQLKVETSPDIARKLEGILLTLVEFQDRIALQASLAVEESPFFRSFLIKALALPKIYDSTTLEMFLDEIPKSENADLLDEMMNAIAAKVTPQDAGTLVNHLDNANERLKTLALKSLSELNHADYFPQIWQQAQKDLPFCQNPNLKGLYETAIQKLFHDDHFQVIQPILTPGAQPDLQAQALNLLASNKRTKKPDVVPALFTLLEADSAQKNSSLIQTAILHHVDASQKSLVFDKLNDTNPSIRSLAAGCLPSVASGADWQTLYEAYKKETHAEVRASLGTVLNVNTTDATPQSELVSLIGNSSDPLLQGLAVKGLRGKGPETLPAIMTALNNMIKPPALPHGGQPQDQLGRDTEDLLHDNLVDIFQKPVGLTSYGGGHIDPKYEAQKQDILPQLTHVREGLNSNSKRIQELSMSILQGYRDTQVVPQLFEMFETNRVADKDRLRVALFDLIQNSDWPLVQEKAKSVRSEVRALAVESLPFLNLSPDTVPVLMRLMWQEKLSDCRSQYETQILSMLKKLDDTQVVSTGGVNDLASMQASVGAHGILKSLLDEASTSEQVLKTLDILFKAAPKGLRNTVLQRYGVDQFEQPKAVLKEWIIQDINQDEAFKAIPAATVPAHLKTALFLPNEDIQTAVLETFKKQQPTYFTNNPELCRLLLNYLESSSALNKEIALPLLERLIFERVDVKPSVSTGGTSANAVDSISEFEASMRTVLQSKMQSADEATRFYAMTIFVKFANKTDIPFMTQALETETSKRIQDTLEGELLRYAPKNNHYPIFTAAFNAARVPYAKLVLAKVISKHQEKVFDELREYVISSISAVAASSPGEASLPKEHLENVMTFYMSYLDSLDQQFYRREPITPEQAARIASLLAVQNEKVQKYATHVLTRYGISEPKKYPVEMVLNALESNLVPEKLASALRAHLFEQRAVEAFTPFYQAKMNTGNTELKALCMRILKKLEKPADFNTLDAMRGQFGSLSPESQEDWLNVMKNTPVPPESIARMISTIQAEENDAILKSLMAALYVTPEVTVTQLSGLHQWVSNAERLKPNQTLQTKLREPLEQAILKLIAKPQITLPELELVLASSSLDLKNQAIDRLRALECPAQKRFELLTNHIENTLLGANGQAPVDLEKALMTMQSQGSDQVFLQNLYQMLESNTPSLKRLATRLLGAWAQKTNPLQAAASTADRTNSARQEELNQAVNQLLKQAVQGTDKALATQSIEVLSELGSNPAVLSPLFSALELAGPQAVDRPTSPFNSEVGKTVIVGTLKIFGEQVLPQLFKKFESLCQARTDVEQDSVLKNKIEQALLDILQEKDVSRLELLQTGLNLPSKAIQAAVVAQINRLLATVAFPRYYVGLNVGNILVPPKGAVLPAAEKMAVPSSNIPAVMDAGMQSNQGRALISMLVTYIKSDGCLEPDKALDVLVSSSQRDQAENHNYLLTLLTVPNPRVKVAALQMIGEALRPSDLPTLFRTLNSELTKNSNADPLLLSTLKSLIVKAGQDPAMLTSLVLELQDATSEVAKQTAVCALEKMGDDALPFLLDTLEATERNDSNLLLVQDLERAIVGIAQTASPEVAVILKDKLLSENREFTKAVSLALTQCLAQWEKYTDPTQMSAVLPALEILSGMTGSALVKLISGNATKVKAKLKSQLATPPVPVATPPAEIPNPEPVSRPPVK